MTDLMLTLWDLIAPRKPKPRVVRRKKIVRNRPVSAPAPGSMAERYERITKQMLAEHSVRVRKWRTSMSGVAWQVEYRDGSIAKLITARFGLEHLPGERKHIGDLTQALRLK